MTIEPYRENIGIAVDGGGIKGAVVAHGIMELERQLGVRALIESPRIKVIAGTSTGAIIAGCLAAGMTGAEILDIYKNAGEKVFSQGGTFRPFGQSLPLLSGKAFSNVAWNFLRGVRGFLDFFHIRLGDFVLYPFFPALYSFEPLREIMHDTLKAHPFGENTNPTLFEVGEYLRTKRHNPTIIITAVEIGARRTHFLKTTPTERYKNMPLVEAILASSCIPTYWDPIQWYDKDKEHTPLFVDGGVGSFGNPALVVAWEMCQSFIVDTPPHFLPEETTIISLGTGTISAKTFETKHRNPKKWWALQWVRRAIDIFSDNAIREQSRTLVSTYMGIDLRRFQVEYDDIIEANRFDLVQGENPLLIQKGEELIQFMQGDRHAMHRDLAIRHDPEFITNIFLAVQMGIPPTPDPE